MRAPIATSGYVLAAEAGSGEEPLESPDVPFADDDADGGQAERYPPCTQDNGDTEFINSIPTGDE